MEHHKNIGSFSMLICTFSLEMNTKNGKSAGSFISFGCFIWRFIAPQALLENVFEKARRRRLFRLRTREDWAEVQGLGSPKNELSAPGASFKRLRDPSGPSPKMCGVVVARN